MKRLCALLLAVSLMWGVTGCRQDTTTKPTGTGDSQSYEEKSQAIYDAALGDFVEAYDAAQEADTVSKRYALMAVAEAELLASAVMLPLTAKGGNYTISRVAPNTAPNALWGSDADRVHNLVITDKPITAEHGDVMKANWAKLKGTGTYETWAKEYLKQQGYKLKNTHSRSYTSDPQTWDVLATSKAADAEAIVNTYDSLYEYDCEGTLQPALANSYTISHNPDGTTTYTFTLKSGLNWVDAQGRKVAKVQADDFVAGFQHMMDAMGGLEYLVEDVIVGAAEYIDGQISISEVGVKALDETTLAYTLTHDIPYFLTMLGYGVFAPMSRSYYTSQGGKFGGEYDPSAPNYTYGKSPEQIAYCGPYLVSNHTAENTIVFTENPAYWNKENINIRKVTWLYNDGQDALKAYTDTVSGVLDGTGLNASGVEKAKTDGVFDTLAQVSACDATTYFAFYNLNRQAKANFNDKSVAVSKKTDTEMARATIALQNVHFRRALSFAVNRSAYNAQTVGEALKEVSLRNTFTPGNFVALEEETTIVLGDKEMTYPKGTYYGEIMQDKLDAEGIPVTVWNPEAQSGIGSSDGFDGWYDPKYAAEELEKAMTELSQQGVTVSADKPIYLDYPYFSGSEPHTNRVNAYKQSVESALGGAVVINPIACNTSQDVYYAGYYISMGSEANYDIYDSSGWGPDYGDPQTYLNTLLPDYVGYMTMMLGIF